LSCDIGSIATNIVGLPDYLGSISSPEKAVLIEYFEKNNDYFCPDVGRAKAVVSELVAYRGGGAYGGGNRVGASDYALNTFPEYTSAQQADNIVDAFRHARLTAIFSRILVGHNDGKDDWGKRLMDANEGPNSGNTEYATYMDYHNNELGWRLFRYLKDNNYSTSDIAIKNGILSLCFTHVVEDVNFQNYLKKINGLNSLVYFKKADSDSETNAEKKGHNCPIARTTNNLSVGFVYPELESAWAYYSNTGDVPYYENRIILNASNSTTYGGLTNVLKYHWSFERPVVFNDKNIGWKCAPNWDCSYIYVYNNIETNYIGTKYNYTWNYLKTNKMVPIWMTDDKPNKVSLRVETVGGVLSESEAVTWIISSYTADEDDDGLTDYSEIVTHLTDPYNSDTDGLTDGYEATIGSDPNNKSRGQTRQIKGSDSLKLLF